ncbi:PQQ-binding-like beta-propeller repeat protein [Rhizohabitans arisaemae]|uniref:outer membrane protein assembly factor BamB family protein n=1 Tax=Rhizohabitans arisaemae TaxID=2720610 RepID=UPI0024B100E6|nr:PQQ-binding-like beta-propeller repeat protein [Rhizohabitans arisaemae]
MRLGVWPDRGGRRAAVVVAGALTLVAALVSGPATPTRAGTTQGAGAVPEDARSSRTASPTPPGIRAGDWPTWQQSAKGNRHNAGERRITPKTVKNLKLKWAYVFENHYGNIASQPAVVGGTLYAGGPDSRFYALDAKTGRQKWVFDLRPHAGPVAPPEGELIEKNPVRDGPTVAGDKVYFGDSRGNLFALNRFTGRLAWMTEVDAHPAALLTGSPLYFDGRVYIGVSSYEYLLAGNDQYPCCTFSGKVVSVDAETGKITWTYRTMPEPKRDGTWPSGAPKYVSSGGSVWSSPAIDPVTRTLYAGSGNNYSGDRGYSDSMLALDIDTGKPRWVRQMTHPDTWTVRCLMPIPPGGSCPGLNDELKDELDYDVGSPGLFTVNGRTLVGFGQKSGIYHALDARTGEIVWQTQLSVQAHNEPWRGVEWGASHDGKRIYVATWRPHPTGTLHALDPATGAILWKNPLPENACSTGGAANPIRITPPDDPPKCVAGLNAAVSSTPGLVYEGGEDGKMRIYSAKTGKVVWTYDAVRMFQGVNGRSGPGGSISGNGGAVISDGMLYVNAGYQMHLGIPGQVMLAFGL